MNYRNALLLATKSIATAGTETIDLDLNDLISRITLLFWGTNTSYTCIGHPASMITQIQVVDGSEVIFSLTGRQAQALSYYNNGHIDGNELNSESGAKAKGSITLNFGRWLYDELFALDPGKYRNLQLKISHNKALGGCTPTAGYLRVFADLFDEKVITPSGYLCGKEIFSYTPSSGAAEYVVLPTDEVIRLLLPMNTSDAQEPHVQFENIKIDEDDGKHVIFDGECLDLLRREANMFDRFTEYISGRVGTAGADFWLSACKDIQLGINGASGTAGYFHGAWSGGVKRNIKGSATVEFGGSCSGRCPHGAVPFFMGKPNDPDDWWDALRVGKARVILTPRDGTDNTTGCSTATTNDIVIQTAVKY